MTHISATQGTLRSTGTDPSASARSAGATVSLQAMIQASTPVRWSGSQQVAVVPPSVPVDETPVARPTSGIRAPDTKPERVASFALAQLGKPYVFATSGPGTFDCSGLVAAAYRQVGLEVPAYTGTQATLGREVDPNRETIRPGDLIFLRGGSPPTDLGHVGIAVSSTEWVRAPRVGDVVKVGPMPAGAIQMVRRLMESDVVNTG